MSHDSKIEINKKLQQTSLSRSILHWVESSHSQITLIWNDHNEIVFVSKSLETFLGYHPDHIVGHQWWSLLSENEVIYLKKQYDPYLSSQRFQVSLQSHDGTNYLFESLVEKVTMDTKKHYFFCTLKDITDKKETEEFFIHSEKMSIAGQIAAGIAHEIRNPLTSLKGFLQLLQTGSENKEAYYKIMMDELNKLESVTSELLFISKPLTNKKEIEVVQPMIEEVILLLNSQAKLKNIELKWQQDVNHTNYYIHCDRSRVKQVLINLVKNAIEATEPSSTICIIVRKAHSNIEIDVIDQGPGIPESIINQITKPFFTTKKNGTGIGLMISEQIIEQHGGRIEIIQNEGKGSTFRIVVSEVKNKV